MKGELIIPKDYRKWKQIFGALETEEDLRCVIRCTSDTEAASCIKSMIRYHKKDEYTIMRAVRVGCDVFVYDKWYEPQIKMRNGMRNLNLINWNRIIDITHNQIHFTRWA